MLIDMKREGITFPIIKTIKPIFWRECRFCNREFKREKGFKIIDIKSCYGSGEDPLYVSYCCNECGNNEIEVEELIKKRKLIFNFNRPKLRK